jgi:hypothetical protein
LPVVTNGEPPASGGAAKPSGSEPIEDALVPAFTSVELGVIAGIATLMIIGSATADQKLAAFGITAVTLAALLATPQLLGRSYGQWFQAKLLRRFPGAGEKPRRGWRLTVATITVAGVGLIGAILAIAGLANLGDSLDVALVGYLIGLILLAGAAIGAYLLSILEQLWKEVLEPGAKEVRGTPRDPKDRVWVAAGLLFLFGSLLQFADVYLPDGPERCQDAAPGPAVELRACESVER